MEKGKAKASIQAGAKRDPTDVPEVCSNEVASNSVEDPKLKRLAPVQMTATGKFCAPDAITNMVYVVAPHICTEELGVELRSYCNGSGRIHVHSLCSQINGKDKTTHGFLLNKIKMTAGDGKPFMDLSPHDRQKKIFDLVSEGKMLIVDYYSKRSSGAIGHVVGVADGKVFDNDAATGGIFDLHAYAAREWDGVYMARIVVPK